MANSIALGLLRDFEGFRTQPYWDVNAWRVGYGSDTITRADGSVVPVRQGMTVSREDAERDLARRVSQEFEPRARDQVGDVLWSRLSPEQQAALISVTYNYGSLPSSVVNAVKSNPAGVADAIASLPANPDRRQREAAVFSGERLAQARENVVENVQARQGGTAPLLRAIRDRMHANGRTNTPFLDRWIENRERRLSAPTPIRDYITNTRAAAGYDTFRKPTLTPEPGPMAGGVDKTPPQQASTLPPYIGAGIGREPGIAPVIPYSGPNYGQAMAAQAMPPKPQPYYPTPRQAMAAEALSQPFIPSPTTSAPFIPGGPATSNYGPLVGTRNANTLHRALQNPPLVNEALRYLR